MLAITMAYNQFSVAVLYPGEATAYDDREKQQGENCWFLVSQSLDWRPKSLEIAFHHTVGGLSGRNVRHLLAEQLALMTATTYDFSDKPIS